MKDTAPLPHTVAGRYRVERLLGVGGMSRVLAVVDERDGRRLALKQLTQSQRATRQARTLALFRQEFHVLTQVAHPNVVAVDEYGFDEDQPFYTMELLVGQALEQLAPLGWRQACAILLDLCSPLSLLHARRFVHSDITARNVLVCENGATKLIDFGALTAIDETTTTIAGTPPYMAPELVHRQLLDTRVDMFALGALAYYALSGRHAYPARSIRKLDAAWETPPRSLSELGVELPAALDHLVLSMLSLDRGARPEQMAELVQRLCAITGETERGAISAHAATPKLVGREPVLEAFRSLLDHAAQGWGELMFIAGASGMGRSRALDACGLEARLCGSLVLRAASEEVAGVEYGMLSSVLASAMRRDPELAPPLAAELAAEPNKADTELELAKLLARQDPRAALDAWFAQLTADRTVVVLVDDLARADLASVQLLLLLAESSKQRRLLIVACAGTGDSLLESKLKGLLKAGRTVKLRPLSAAETEHLLRSMFGDMPQLAALASWVHSAAAGVPAACVELAHYAVARGVVTYQGGQFQVAGDLARLELPRGYDDAIASRIRALNPHAREALGALSLLTAFGPLSTPEHAELLGYAGWSQTEALSALDELRDTQLVKPRADGYELHSEAVRRLAATELGEGDTKLWHGRIGAFYVSRGHARSMLASLHLEYAGERESAYEHLLLVDGNIKGPDDPNVPVGGSALGIGLHQTMLAHAVAKQCRIEILHLRCILLELAATSNPSLANDGLDLLEQLRIDAGLDRWELADPELTEHQKLLWCLAGAEQRYLDLPAAQRGYPVREAVRRLAQSASVLASICTLTFDRDTATRLVRLFEPLRTLTPVLGVAYDLLETAKLGLTRSGRMTERWSKALEALATRPDGMRELIWRYVVSNLQCHVAREAAVLGDDRYADHAEPLTRLRRRQRQVLSLDLLHALAHGRFDESRRLRRELDISGVATGNEDQMVAFAYIAELELLDACGDLLEMQRLSSWFDTRARRYPGWAPFAAIARASCFLLCDQPAAAESAAASQLEAAPVLEHAAWYSLRALHAESILLAGDAALAKQLALDVLQQAAGAGLNMSPNIRAERVLALANAALGDTAAAAASLEPLMREAEGSFTVRAGQVFEARARVALAAADRDAYTHCLARVKASYGAGGYPGLLARLERLQSAARRMFDLQAESAGTAAPYAGVESELQRLNNRERAAYLLSLLMADSRASSGKLYAVQTTGIVTLANVNAECSGDSSLDDSVSEYVAQLSALDEDTTRCESHVSHATDAVSSSRLSRTIPYAVIPLRDRNDVLRGVALLRSDTPADKLACAPALCSLVGDALARL